MQPKIKIKPQSYLLTGSGEGGALIDSDVVFHKSGFPFIPARRIKGLLKESLEEVLEMLGENGIKCKIEDLFGKEGEKYGTGKLRIGNAYLPDWGKIQGELKELQKENHLNKGEGAAFDPGNIQQFFTSEIQQTALDERQIAKKRSLRNYRVLVPKMVNGKKEEKPVEFEADITFTNTISQIEKQWLENAALNLRYAGTRRNRGFGKVKCELSIQDRFIKKEDKIETQPGEGDRSEPLVSRNQLNVSIFTKSPIVLALLLGDQNTVFTEKHISGNRLRGLLATKYIQLNKLEWNTAHTDNGHDFYKLFLSGKLKFEACCLEGTEQIPQNIHRYKGDDEQMPIDVFQKQDSDDAITKPFGNMGNYSSGELAKNEPKTTFFFHNSRKIRRAGRSTEAEPGIFYYEAIDDRQTFTGTIKGAPEILSTLINGVGGFTFTTRMGRSRSAQYGEIEVTLTEGNQETVEVEHDRLYYLIAETPIILLNEHGNPEASQNTLVSYLADAGCVVKTIENAVARTTYIEQYNATWQSKSGKIVAYQEGSVFRMEFENNSDLNRLAKSGLGEWTEQGFGKVKLIAKKDFPVNFCFNEEIENENGNLNGKTNEATHPQDDTLKAILKKYQTESREMKVRAMAAKAAEPKKGKFSGHFISRMEAMFKAKTTEAEVNKWLKAVAKPILDNLDRLDFYKKNDDDYIFKMPAGVNGFLEARSYYMTFFQTLRKLNKQKNG